MSPKLLATLKSIDRLTREVGCPPTLSELAAEFGVNKVSIHERLAKLQAARLVTRKRHRARSITITPAGLEHVERPKCPHCGGAL